MRRHVSAWLAATALLAATAAPQLPAPPGGAVKRTERATQESDKSEQTAKTDKAATGDAKTEGPTEPRARRPIAPMRDAWMRFKREDSRRDPAPTDQAPATRREHSGGEDKDRIREHIRDRAADHSSRRDATHRGHARPADSADDHPPAKGHTSRTARRKQRGAGR